MAKSKVPDHLEPTTRRWCQGILREFALEEHQLKTLFLAGQALDRAEQARLRLAEDGAFLPDRFDQLKPHPALAVERDAMLCFVRLLRELNLEPVPDDTRPPNIIGRYK